MKKILKYLLVALMICSAMPAVCADPFDYEEAGREFFTIALDTVADPLGDEQVREFMALVRGADLNALNEFDLALLKGSVLELFNETTVAREKRFVTHFQLCVLLPMHDLVTTCVKKTLEDESKRGKEIMQYVALFAKYWKGESEFTPEQHEQLRGLIPDVVTIRVEKMDEFINLVCGTDLDALNRFDDFYEAAEQFKQELMVRERERRKCVVAGLKKVMEQGYTADLKKVLEQWYKNNAEGMKYVIDAAWVLRLKEKNGFTSEQHNQLRELLEVVAPSETPANYSSGNSNHSFYNAHPYFTCAAVVVALANLGYAGYWAYNKFFAKKKKKAETAPNVA